MQHGFSAVLGGVDLASAFAQQCFAAGTPLRTPEGSKPIEEFAVGDLILTAPDDDPEAEPVVGRVTGLFASYSPLCRLTVGGKTIRTTAEHPFWVKGRGWRHAHQIESGDELRAEDGRWLAVEAVEGNEGAEPVYNVAVEEYHTYFVGEGTWGFAVWAHNAKCGGDAAKNREEWIAKGLPASALGPSGKPKRVSVTLPTRKRAYEAAQQNGQGPPLHNPSDVGQAPHFHATNRRGEKYGRQDPHYYYPNSQR